MTKNFEINSSNKETKTSTYIDIREKDDKLLAFVTDSVAGVRQPTRMGFLDVVGEGQNKFMTLRAPLRAVDAEGNFMTRARQRDGKFLDATGKEVDSEDKAAVEYLYQTQRGDESKIVYGQIATLNVVNTKADGSPTKSTFISVKLSTDAEALASERLVYTIGKLNGEGQDSTAVKEELKELRKTQGTYANFFVNKGAQALRDMGFEVREKAVDSTPAP